LKSWQKAARKIASRNTLRKRTIFRVLRPVFGAPATIVKNHDEFDGMPYSKYWGANERGANTYLEPKKNKEDSNYFSGTIRRKFFPFLSELLKLDFFAADIVDRDFGIWEILLIGLAPLC
jgi:hypothetical protein